jgi:muramidase (phage lysozyme)
MRTHGYFCALLLGCLTGQLAADPTSDLRATLTKHCKNARVSAFLRVIASLEIGDQEPFAGYLTHYTKAQADSWASHTERNIGAQYRGKELWSTAFGRYQFLRKTWEDVSKKLGLKTIGPREQDLAAIYLLLDCGALDYILRGQIRVAVRLARNIWASFPGSPYGQKTYSIAEFEKKYKMFYRKILENRKIRAQAAGAPAPRRATKTKPLPRKR